MVAIVYLGLGSNLGDRRANLLAAAQGLPPLARVLRESSIYETEPWGFQDQPAFLNQVIEAETSLPPMGLLAALKTLETNLGRQDSFRYGPRLIDLDILLYDQLVLNQPDLVIPHPHLSERAFTLVPLAELAPILLHPVLGKSMAELRAKLDLSGVKLVKYKSPRPVGTELSDL
jgi:2-amino-4-hydroxy-6-hydroxymethyldihydropteridine diphosphokinase